VRASSSVGRIGVSSAQLLEAPRHPLSSAGVRLAHRDARVSRNARATDRQHSAANVLAVSLPSLSSVEFPADDPERARRFWMEFLGVELEARTGSEGEGWQTHSGAPAVGVHKRGRGPGDSLSLPYFAVVDVAEALEKVAALGGSVVHPGERWAICRDSEGSPFGLTRESLGA
jgi:predicted enzyme related to lactoylglutathione lyase